MSDQPAADNPNQYPPGWDAERAQRVIDHLDHLTDDEWAAEDEAAFGDPDSVVVEIPRMLLPTVESMIRAFETARGQNPAAGKKASA